MVNKILKIIPSLIVISAGILLGWTQNAASEDAPVTLSSGTEDVSPAASPLMDVLDFNQIEITDVLKIISQKVNRNIAASQNVKGRITIYLKNITVLDALRVIVDAYSWAFVEEGDIIKVMTSQEYEDRFGQKFGKPFTTRIYELHFGNTTSISTLLNQVKSPSGKVLADEKSNTLVIIDSPDKFPEIDAIIKRLDVLTQTQVFDLSYAKAKDISTEITPLLTPSLGMMKSDDRSNRIIVTDTARVLKQVQDLIRAFDIQHKEVLIQAKIVQITLDDAHKMGVDWEAVVNKFQKLTFKTSLSVLSDTDKRGKVSVGTLSDDDFQAVIEALNSMVSTKILSSPRITALNNEEAKILVGSTEPYVSTTTTTPSSGPVTSSETVNFIDVGVKLYVTPTIHNDGFITMKIRPEVSTAANSITTSTNNTIPIVEASEAETKVMVKDGVTIILGGLIKDEKSRTEKSVPVLGKIPLLGRAFRSDSDSVNKTEIAIFIKPTIITGDIDKKNVDEPEELGLPFPP
ncbi:MAG: type II secretion system protein GspD [Candidatus Omnitrophica bacterium]|nr:type II secretion system protein GspD [Candidatus Omnitrophota bacterium]